MDITGSENYQILYHQSWMNGFGLTSYDLSKLAIMSSWQYSADAATASILVPVCVLQRGYPDR